MCGLCGTFAPTGAIDRRAVVAMHDRMAHRGPDETYSLNTAAVSVKLARLGMTGLARGWQPAEDRADRLVAMTNGEIFNAPGLRAELGVVDHANSVDVAVIPQLVADAGIDGLARVDGQFATVIVDRADGSLTLARDRFGICPLYYTVDDGVVHFCSELKALVQSVPRTWRLDLGAVDQFLALGNVVAPRTLVRGVQAVPPGCSVRFAADGSVLTRRYWRYGEFAAPPQPPSGAALRESLRLSTEARLTADVEIGAYLSGGLDSTIILLESTDILKRPVRTYSVVFDDPALDEGRFQREVAQHLGSKHDELMCGGQDVVNRFEEMVRHCCYPQRETYNVAAMMLAESVKAAGLKGVVSGEGADELFFGYDSYAFDSAPVRAAATTAVENEQAWGRADFGWEVDWRKADARRRTYLTPAVREALAGDEFWRTRLIPFTDAETRALSRMQLRSIADVYVQLAGHLLGDHGDAMTMRSSVEGRYPFLGNTVVDAALRTPDEAKMVDFEGKACLRAAYQGDVPDCVLRRAKHGFTAPALRAHADPGTWAGWCELVRATGVFNPDCLDPAPEGPGSAERWDFGICAISVALVMDELRLKV